jgi:hypothetical protein
MEKFFSSLDLYDVYTLMGINCCGTLRSQWKEMNDNFGKKMKLKWVISRIWRGMTWHSYHGKTICQHADKYAPSTSTVNFLWRAQICSETSQWLNCYCHSRWTWKWAKLLFLHILDLSNLTSSVILIACGSETSQKHLGFALIRGLTQQVKRLPQHLTTQPGKTEHLHILTKNT